MDDTELHNLEVATMMRQNGAAFRSLINTRIAEALAEIVSSKPEQRDLREMLYLTINVLQGLLQDAENSVTMDDHRRNQQTQS